MSKSIRFKILAVIISFSLLFIVIFLVSVAINYSNYKKAKISEIEKITVVNVEKINRSVGLMENCAMNLATYGSYYHATRRAGGAGAEEAMKRFLVNTFSDFKIALGGGIWYDPYILEPGIKLYGPYAFFDKGKVVFTWDLNTEKYNYPGQDWFTFALPKDWDRTKKREKDFYWTAPYTDESGSNSLMITVDAFMYDMNRKIIGISTVDWSLDEIIKFLNEIRITPNSRTFLADLGSKKIITYTADNSMIMKDINQVPMLAEIAAGNNCRTTCCYMEKDVSGKDYHVFSILTTNNMLYGVMIPDNEFLTEAFRSGAASITVSLLLVIILVASMNLVVGKQLSPMKRMNRIMKEIAEGGGDLTRTIDIHADDEIGQFAKSFNEFMIKIKSIASTIMQSADYLTTASSDLNVSSSSLTDNANRQAATSEQITSTVEELSATSENTADISNTQHEKFDLLSAMVSRLSDNASQLESAVKDSLSLSLRISDEALSGDAQLKLMNSSMEKITESSQKVMGIIGIINDISDRINLLALNAAIEAARAGEAGKGFAVVADEISKLADQTSTSIKDIDSLIRLNKTEIEQGRDTVLKSIEILGNITNQVSNVSERMQGIFKNTEEQINIKTEIGSHIESLQALSSQIRNASEEQKYAFKEIVKGITDVSLIAQSTASSAEQVAGSSDAISNLSKEISSTVRSFRT